jgi:DNA-binding NtrC family response regulator
MSPSEKPPLLLVDDEATVRMALGTLLSTDYQVFEASSGEEALALLAKREIGVVLLDIAMPGLDGQETLKAVKASYPCTEVVMVTAVKKLEQAVACMKAGAYDFLTKPWEVMEIQSVIRRAMEKWRLTRENQFFRLQQGGAKKEVEILGKSPAIALVRDMIAKVAAYDSTVLVTGESGTGKELVAAAIHAQSPRAQGRFVAISCAALPSELAESELFGHEKGAFSSAIAMRVGRFEYASGGTLYLDDVPTLPLPLQAKLLRVLQEREITRVGSNRLIPVDVRLIASANEDLADLVKRGRFREDLYHRLSVVPIALPPLRERGDDYRELFKIFVERFCRRRGRPAPRIPDKVFEVLKHHPFPGNVRELANLAETMVVLSPEGEIGLTGLPVQALLNPVLDEGPVADSLVFRDAVKEFERQLIVRTLQACNNNQTQAAAQLKIHRNSLINKMRDLQIKH